MQNSLWQNVLGEIETQISEANFSTFLKDTELIEQIEDSVTIMVKNVFVIRQCEKKYSGLIKETLAHHGVNINRINYELPKTSTKKTVNRETTYDEIAAARPTRITNTSASIPSTPPATLNPVYTFDSFIVGSSNDLANAASQAVAAEPGTKYNPLYLYGGVGLGKTHLMQAIGNEILRNNPNTKILYINTETFVKEYVDMIRFKKKSMSDKYRTVDVLIVDDMQFIAGKEKVQEEFFHTFNALHQANKQIIISSDKPPKSIPTLTERLRSRFEWGMSVDIQMPDFETRAAIIETKAALKGFDLDRQTVEYLAKNFKTNIRELEGALNQLLAFSEMRNVQPDLSTAEGLLGNVRRSRPQHVTAKQIVDRTAKYFSLATNEMTSDKRDKHIVTPRQIAMYLLRSELHLSFPKIAEELGRKDHTTAMHSIEKIEKAIKLDFTIREQVADIRERLYA